MCNLMFKQGTDMDVAYREVRDRVERARLQMPDDVEQVFIYKDDSSGIPIFFLGLAIDPAVVDVYNLIQDEVVLPLQRIDGVASIDPPGLVEEKQILIELDRESARTPHPASTSTSSPRSSPATTSLCPAAMSITAGKKLLLRSVARYESASRSSRRRLVGPNIRAQGHRDHHDTTIPEIKYPRARHESAGGGADGPHERGRCQHARGRRQGSTGRQSNELIQRTRGSQLIEIAALFDQGEVIMESLTRCWPAARSAASSRSWCCSSSCADSA